MKSSTKGALLSGLVFPGSGQIALKCYKRGVVLMLTALLCLSVIVIKAIEQAFSILDKINLNGGAVDINEITHAATQVSTSSDSLASNLIFLLIIICWVYSIVDAYSIGKEMDIDKEATR